MLWLDQSYQQPNGLRYPRWGGVGEGWEQEKLEAWKMLENAAREASHTACPEPVEGSGHALLGVFARTQDSLVETRYKRYRSFSNNDNAKIKPSAIIASKKTMTNFHPDGH